MNLSKKQLECELKIKLCGKRLYPTESVKFLGVKIDTDLTWQYYVNDLFTKLYIYFAIFGSYMFIAVLPGLRLLALSNQF